MRAVPITNDANPTPPLPFPAGRPYLLGRRQSMPEKRTTQRARRDRRQGKKASTQAGHYVAEEMRHKKSGKHPVKNRKQAIAIGLSKARRSGVKVPKRG